jgi:hypothetical protein
MKTLFATLSNHERYQSISVLIAVAVIVWFVGCEPKTQSILEPGKTITRANLQLELDTITRKAEIGFANIEQQERLRELIFKQGLIAAQTGTIDPIALMTSVFGIVGVGAVVDNVRKRRTIKDLSAKK